MHPSSQRRTQRTGSSPREAPACQARVGVGSQEPRPSPASQFWSLTLSSFTDGPNKSSVSVSSVTLRLSASLHRQACTHVQLSPQGRNVWVLTASMESTLYGNWHCNVESWWALIMMTSNERGPKIQNSNNPLHCTVRLRSKIARSCMDTGCVDSVVDRHAFKATLHTVPLPLPYRVRAASGTGRS